MVVNYDMPLMNERDKTADERPDIETYIHRIGMSFIFFTVLNGLLIRLQDMDQIEKALGRPIIRIETHDIDQMEKNMKKALK
ncbi:hypothetical protein C0993_007822 [Termitomyces sp. T159_Od127]|nr:hypothetical protein C0993_007822 [Termitomyces sp. T159_Od127]